jgi:transposase
MRTGRPKTELILTDDEWQHLVSLSHRARTAAQPARRARIVLACADGQDNKVVARRLRVSQTTVCKWRARFLAQRIDGLYDEPRPGTPRQITDAQVEHVIIRTLETTPRGATHWSTRDMAKAAGLSHVTIGRIWRAFGLQPHRTETFKLSPDPLLIDKVRDIVGLYLHPPAHALVLCVDEKPQIQALNRTAPLLPMQPGQVERRTHDYKRHGTTSLFAALNVKTGTVIGDIQPRHRAIEFRQFLSQIDAHVPTDLDVHHHGQLQHAQSPDCACVVREAPAFSRAFHADVCLVAQPSRTLVCRARSQGAAPWLAHQRHDAQGRHPRLH